MSELSVEGKLARVQFLRACEVRCEREGESTYDNASSPVSVLLLMQKKTYFPEFLTPKILKMCDPILVTDY